MYALCLVYSRDLLILVEQINEQSDLQDAYNVSDTALICPLHQMIAHEEN